MAGAKRHNKPRRVLGRGQAREPLRGINATEGELKKGKIAA